METTTARTGSEPRTRLSAAPVRAVLRVEDYQRARAFYTEVLGLPVDDMPGGRASGIVMAGNGTEIELYERRGAPAPATVVLAFRALDFDATVADLRSRGVALEDPGFALGVRTVHGVADVGGAKVAWFKDSEGNILALGTM